MIDPSAWQPRAATLFAGAALVWAVSLYGLFVDERLVYALALVPRRIDGLPGILSAPLVHSSFAHLLANTVPLLILGGLAVIRGVASYLTTTLAIVVLGGLANARCRLPPLLTCRRFWLRRVRSRGSDGAHLRTLSSRRTMPKP